METLTKKVSRIYCKLRPSKKVNACLKISSLIYGEVTFSKKCIYKKSHDVEFEKCNYRIPTVHKEVSIVLLQLYEQKLAYEAINKFIMKNMLF
jgi:hypothetical protein